MKTLKIGLTESLGFYNKKPPQEVLSQKWCRCQACAVALHTAALRPRSPKTARFPSPNFGRLGHRTLLRKPNPPPTKHHNKKPPRGRLFVMVPLARIGLATPSLPMTCSTTELQRHDLSHHARGNIPKHFIKIKS